MYTAFPVIALTTPDFEKVVEGVLNVRDFAVAERGSPSTPKLRPTGRTYYVPEFGGFMFFECLEVK